MAEHHWADTTAAQMLAAGLRTAALERGLSLREIGRRLDYKQPVVLSHMANGRVPIPIDRALEIAREVGLPPKQFLEAVLQQRHPEVDWRLITGGRDPFATELEAIAGKPLSALGPSHQRVLREVVRDPKPEDRWLAVPEISTVKLLREIFPDLPRSGLSADDREDLNVLAMLWRGEAGETEKGEAKKNER